MAIYLSAATSFDRRNSQAMLSGNWQAKAVKDLDRLQGKLPDDAIDTSVLIEGKPCSDTMSGEKFQTSVTLKTGAQTLKGESLSELDTSTSE